MSVRSIFAAAVATGAILAGASAWAQDPLLGKAEFRNSCVVCHGETGVGDGPVGELFAQKPKNLRVLAKENGGDYPFAKVYEAIDGRAKIIAHGTSEMPIWGDYLMADTMADRNIRPSDAQMVVEARIIALVQYIQTLQAP